MDAMKLMVNCLKADQEEYKSLRKGLINLIRKLELEEMPFSVPEDQGLEICAAAGKLSELCSQCIRDLEAHIDDVENDVEE